MIKVLIVDDHILIREGLKKVLADEIDMMVVAECKDAPAALDYLQDGECDVMVLDINMPGKSGLDLLKDLELIETSVKVLVLSINPEERFALRALQAGASGYLTKESAAEELVQAIRKVHYGGKYITPSVAEQLATFLQHNPSLKPHESLSDREFQILQLIGAGKSPAEITELLSLSASTVKTYRQRILQKLNLKSTAEIIRYSLNNNLID